MRAACCLIGLIGNGEATEPPIFVNDEVNSVARQTTVDRLAADLRNEIKARKFEPGTPLREEELARQYSVSRHVLRAALRVLVNDGIAEYAAFKGARVATISAEDITDIYQARQVIEVAGLRRLDRSLVEQLATTHGLYSAAVEGQDWDAAFAFDIQFHGILAAAAGSTSLSALHRSLFRKLELAHLIRDKFREPGLTASVSQHADIVIALAANQVERAEQALVGHLEHSSRSVATG
jgi:DNA-binding GntR family transcriptional regulator